VNNGQKIVVNVVIIGESVHLYPHPNCLEDTPHDWHWWTDEW